MCNAVPKNLEVNRYKLTEKESWIASNIDVHTKMVEEYKNVSKSSALEWFLFDIQLPWTELWRSW